MKLNQPIIQLVNYLAYPLQLVSDSILPLRRAFARSRTNTAIDFAVA